MTSAKSITINLHGGMTNLSGCRRVFIVAAEKLTTDVNYFNMTSRLW